MRSLAPKFPAWTVAAGVAAVLVTAGCVSSDLSKDADTTAEVVECLPTDTPAPTVVVRAFWYPHASGFGDAEAHEAGVLALAGGKLWFVEWNGPGRHFDVEHVVNVLQASSVGVSRFGTSSMLVIQSGNLAFDSFELMNGGDIGSDPKATQALYDRIQALRG